MATKRGRKSNRTVPYDPEFVENWTIARLQQELHLLNVPYRSCSKRMELVKKLKEAQAALRGAVSQHAPSDAIASHDAPRQDGRQTGSPERADSTSLRNMISSLADSVNTLQNCYCRLENSVLTLTQSRSVQPTSAAAAGSSRQMATDGIRAPTPTTHVANSPLMHPGSTLAAVTEEFTLDSAYRKLQEESIPSGDSADVQIQTAGTSSRCTTNSMSAYGLIDDELNTAVDSLWNHALSEKTLATYKSGLNCFVTFLVMRGIACAANSLPIVDEDLLIFFVTYCQEALCLKFDTIKLYLAGIRFHYIKLNLGDPLANTMRLNYILRGIKRTQVNFSNKRLPITFKLLNHMCITISSSQGLFEPFVKKCYAVFFKQLFMVF
ncbi:uncharacterized protein LOC132545878 [Ylistrum balloti]|uniref:uncharacterized protein LOC132545878 n=1 Tax=Ylistrum balloti TaxID=509963 RepID=UPI002905845F|nr:uncharacterized protein LOC132545878 [Ylistrum balloti]